MERTLTIAEIRERLGHADRQEYEAMKRSLAADTRKGVVAALAACERRLEKEEAERDRVGGLYAFDRESLQGAEGHVVGLDEVGRGAVAGPLAVGAVVLPQEPMIEGLNDSKQIAPAEREVIAERVKSFALAWTVFYVEPDAIDGQGMALSLREAFKGALNAIEQTGLPLGRVLVDGNPLGLDSREISVVKGDSKSASIAAASIIAKVERDRLMVDLDSTYPQYGFSSHKGYGSQGHIAAIETHGLSPIHRRSFCRSFTQQTLF